ncbi:hypothetical protein TNCV_4521441 [Trichonephila clavipes]|nr:hypothetical protein TNCV_4521441 [Trichonephila clavipes]
MWIKWRYRSEPNQPPVLATNATLPMASEEQMYLAHAQNTSEQSKRHACGSHVLKEYCEDDDLLILPAGLGPVKSRQDELTNRKYARKPNELTSTIFFRTNDCIENDTTMEDDSFRQESPVNTSKENQSFFFPEFDLNKFSSFQSFLAVLINNV